MIATRPLLDRFVGLMQVANAFYRGNPANPPKQVDIAQDDVQQLFRGLNRHRVRYLLVGGMARGEEVIHLTDLITEKQATGRLKDLGDVDELEKLIPPTP